MEERWTLEIAGTENQAEEVTSKSGLRHLNVVSPEKVKIRCPRMTYTS